jgi:hypothetical protein
MRSFACSRQSVRPRTLRCCDASGAFVKFFFIAGLFAHFAPFSSNRFELERELLLLQRQRQHVLQLGLRVLALHVQLGQRPRIQVKKFVARRARTNEAGGFTKATKVDLP